MSLIKVKGLKKSMVLVGGLIYKDDAVDKGATLEGLSHRSGIKAVDFELLPNDYFVAITEAKLAKIDEYDKAYQSTEEYILEVEFQAERKAEEEAAIEEKRKAFKKKRKAKK